MYVAIMRFVDALMSFPMLLLALVVAALLGGGMKNVVIALGVSMMPAYARLMCGQVLSAKENDYVLAGRSLGASNQRLMFLTALPNCFSPLLVMSMMMGIVFGRSWFELLRHWRIAYCFLGIDDQ
jgi:ABC-type dipeptide/oligopeptide/nickel transport system permease subunit